MKHVATVISAALLVVVACGGEKPAPATPPPSEPAATVASSAAPEEAASASAAPAPSASVAPPQGDVPKVSLTVAGTAFKPSMAYLVGPVYARRVTLVVTEETAHGSCEKAIAAAEMKPRLKVRIFYSNGGGFVLDKPGKVPADGAGAAPYAQLTSKDGAPIDFTGKLQLDESPDAKGKLAHMKMALKQGKVTVEGDLQAIVCVTKEDLN